MTRTFRKPSAVSLATACILLGLLAGKAAIAQGNNPLPLSGPAFVLADEAYKAYALGNYQEAADKAREASRLRPDVPSLAALVRQAESAQRSPPRRVGDGPASVARSGSARRSGVFRAAPESPAFVAAQAGYSAYEGGRFDDAVDKASTAVRLAPRNARYHLLLINALVGANRLAEADQAVTTAALASGESRALDEQRTVIAQRRAQAPGAAAFAALERKDAVSAIANARSAIRLSPNDLAYRQLLVHALLLSEMFQDAETAATQAMALDATDPSPQVLRAYARQRLGRRADAVSDFNQALAQPTLGASGRRQIRLIAADAALDAQDPAAALALLKDLPPGADEQADEQVAQRRRAATRALAGPGATVGVATAATAGFAPPMLDCARLGGPQRCLVLPSNSGGQAQPGFAMAAAAYKAFDDGRFQDAALAAEKAVELAPANRDYKQLQLSALTRAGSLQEADSVATTLLAETPKDASLLAQRGQIRQRLGQVDLAQTDFGAALAASSEANAAGASPQVAANRLPAAIEIGLLVDAGRRTEARRRFDQAATGSTGDFAGLSDTEVAYLGARVGNDTAALAAFNRADVAGKLANTSYQDAAFSAVHAREDAQALAYFKRAIDDVGALRLRMEPRLLFDTRRAVAEVSREGGVIASLTYRGAVSGLGVTPGVGTDSLQAGVEGYWRPWGYQNGEYVELFARAFQTLYSKGGGAKGPDTLQAAVGVRYKPFAEQNLVGSFSRVFAPSGGRNDWLAQLGYSADNGTDLRIDVPSWWTTKTSAEIGRYLSEGQNYALGQFQAGRSYRVGDGDTEGSGRWVLYPHISLAADYDSTAIDKTSVGLGPGLTGRYWFREDTYAAPRSYLDLSVQYRARIGGAERAKGLFVNTTLSY